MKSLILAIFAIVILTLLSCSESTNNTGTATVKIYTDLKSPFVSLSLEKGNDIILAKETVDSLRITNLRFLIKEIKLYKSNDDTSKTGQIVKVGPLLFEANNLGQAILICSENIPIGTYDKVKFEFHRFSTSELDKYKDDPIFKDFATNERYSAIIDGLAYKNGIENIFKFNSTYTANLAFNLDSPLEFKDNEVKGILIEFDPKVTFKLNNEVLDPRDGKNQNDIDNSLKLAIKAIKKLLN